MGACSLPVPVDIPPRAVLHYRTRLALSLLNHRPPCGDTVALVRRVLVGDLDVQLTGSAGGEAPAP